MAVWNRTEFDGFLSSLQDEGADPSLIARLQELSEEAERRNAAERLEYLASIVEAAETTRENHPDAELGGLNRILNMIMSAFGLADPPANLPEDPDALTTRMIEELEAGMESDDAAIEPAVIEAEPDWEAPAPHTAEAEVPSEAPSTTPPASPAIEPTASISEFTIPESSTDFARLLSDPNTPNEWRHEAVAYLLAAPAEMNDVLLQMDATTLLQTYSYLDDAQRAQFGITPAYRARFGEVMHVTESAMPGYGDSSAPSEALVRAETWRDTALPIMQAAYDGRTDLQASYFEPSPIYTGAETSTANGRPYNNVDGIYDDIITIVTQGMSREQAHALLIAHVSDPNRLLDSIYTEHGAFTPDAYTVVNGLITEYPLLAQTYDPEGIYAATQTVEYDLELTLARDALGNVVMVPIVDDMRGFTPITVRDGELIIADEFIPVDSEAALDEALAIEAAIERKSAIQDITADIAEAMQDGRFDAPVETSEGTITVLELLSMDDEARAALTIAGEPVDHYLNYLSDHYLDETALANLMHDLDGPEHDADRAAIIANSAIISPLDTEEQLTLTREDYNILSTRIVSELDEVSHASALAVLDMVRESPLPDLDARYGDLPNPFSDAENANQAAHEALIEQYIAGLEPAELLQLLSQLDDPALRAELLSDPEFSAALDGQVIEIEGEDVTLYEYATDFDYQERQSELTLLAADDPEFAITLLMADPEHLPANLQSWFPDYLEGRPILDDVTHHYAEYLTTLPMDPEASEFDLAETVENLLNAADTPDERLAIIERLSNPALYTDGEVPTHVTENMMGYHRQLTLQEVGGGALTHLYDAIESGDFDQPFDDGSDLTLMDLLASDMDTALYGVDLADYQGWVGSELTVETAGSLMHALEEADRLSLLNNDALMGSVDADVQASLIAEDYNALRSETLIRLELLAGLDDRDAGIERLEATDIDFDARSHALYAFIMDTPEPFSDLTTRYGTRPLPVENGRDDAIGQIVAAMTPAELALFLNNLTPDERAALLADTAFSTALQSTPATLDIYGNPLEAEATLYDIALQQEYALQISEMLAFEQMGSTGFDPALAFRLLNGNEMDDTLPPHLVEYITEHRLELQEDAMAYAIAYFDADTTGTRFESYIRELAEENPRYADQLLNQFAAQYDEGAMPDWLSEAQTHWQATTIQTEAARFDQLIHANYDRLDGDDAISAGAFMETALFTPDGQEEAFTLHDLLTMTPEARDSLSLRGQPVDDYVAYWFQTYTEGVDGDGVGFMAEIAAQMDTDRDLLLANLRLYIPESEPARSEYLLAYEEVVGQDMALLAAESLTPFALPIDWSDDPLADREHATTILELMLADAPLGDLEARYGVEFATAGMGREALLDDLLAYFPAPEELSLLLASSNNLALTSQLLDDPAIMTRLGEDGPALMESVLPLYQTEWLNLLDPSSPEYNTALATEYLVSGTGPVDTLPASMQGWLDEQDISPQALFTETLAAHFAEDPEAALAYFATIDDPDTRLAIMDTLDDPELYIDGIVPDFVGEMSDAHERATIDPVIDEVMELITEAPVIDDALLNTQIDDGPPPITLGELLQATGESPDLNGIPLTDYLSKLGNRMNQPVGYGEMDMGEHVFAGMENRPDLRAALLSNPFFMDALEPDTRAAVIAKDHQLLSEALLAEYGLLGDQITADTLYPAEPVLSFLGEMEAISERDEWDLDSRYGSDAHGHGGPNAVLTGYIEGLSTQQFTQLLENDADRATLLSDPRFIRAMEDASRDEGTSYSDIAFGIEYESQLNLIINNPEYSPEFIVGIISRNEAFPELPDYLEDYASAQDNTQALNAALLASLTPRPEAIEAFLDSIPNPEQRSAWVDIVTTQFSDDPDLGEAASAVASLHTEQEQERADSLHAQLMAGANATFFSEAGASPEPLVPGSEPPISYMEWLSATPLTDLEGVPGSADRFVDTFAASLSESYASTDEIESSRGAILLTRMSWDERNELLSNSNALSDILQANYPDTYTQMVTDAQAMFITEEAQNLEAFLTTGTFASDRLGWGQRSFMPGTEHALSFRYEGDSREAVIQNLIDRANAGDEEATLLLAELTSQLTVVDWLNLPEGVRAAYVDAEITREMLAENQDITLHSYDSLESYLSSHWDSVDWPDGFDASLDTSGVDFDGTAGSFAALFDNEEAVFSLAGHENLTFREYIELIETTLTTESPDMAPGSLYHAAMTAVEGNPVVAAALAYNTSPEEFLYISQRSPQALALMESEAYLLVMQSRAAESGEQFDTMLEYVSFLSQQDKLHDLEAIMLEGAAPVTLFTPEPLTLESQADAFAYIQSYEATRDPAVDLALAEPFFTGLDRAEMQQLMHSLTRDEIEQYFGPDGEYTALLSEDALTAANDEIAARLAAEHASQLLDIRQAIQGVEISGEPPLTYDVEEESVTLGDAMPLPVEHLIAIIEADNGFDAADIFTAEGDHYQPMTPEEALEYFAGDPTTLTSLLGTEHPYSMALNAQYGVVMDNEVASIIAEVNASGTIDAALLDRIEALPADYRDALFGNEPLSIDLARLDMNNWSEIRDRLSELGMDDLVTAGDAWHLDGIGRETYNALTANPFAPYTLNNVDAAVEPLVFESREALLTYLADNPDFAPIVMGNFTDPSAFQHFLATLEAEDIAIQPFFRADAPLYDALPTDTVRDAANASIDSRQVDALQHYIRGDDRYDYSDFTFLWDGEPRSLTEIETILGRPLEWAEVETLIGNEGLEVNAIFTEPALPVEAAYARFGDDLLDAGLREDGAYLEDIAQLDYHATTITALNEQIDAMLEEGIDADTLTSLDTLLDAVASLPADAPLRTDVEAILAERLGPDTAPQLFAGIDATSYNELWGQASELGLIGGEPPGPLSGLFDAERASQNGQLPLQLFSALLSTPEDGTLDFIGEDGTLTTIDFSDETSREALWNFLESHPELASETLALFDRADMAEITGLEGTDLSFESFIHSLPEDELAYFEEGGALWEQLSESQQTIVAEHHAALLLGNQIAELQAAITGGELSFDALQTRLTENPDIDLYDVLTNPPIDGISLYSFLDGDLNQIDVTQLAEPLQSELLAYDQQIQYAANVDALVNAINADGMSIEELNTLYQLTLDDSEPPQIDPDIANAIEARLNAYAAFGTLSDAQWTELQAEAESLGLIGGEPAGPLTDFFAEGNAIQTDQQIGQLFAGLLAEPFMPMDMVIDGTEVTLGTREDLYHFLQTHPEMATATFDRFDTVLEGDGREVDQFSLWVDGLAPGESERLFGDPDGILRFAIDDHQISRIDAELADERRTDALRDINAAILLGSGTELTPEYRFIAEFILSDGAEPRTLAPDAGGLSSDDLFYLLDQQPEMDVTDIFYAGGLINVEQAIAWAGDDMPALLDRLRAADPDSPYLAELEAEYTAFIDAQERDTLIETINRDGLTVERLEALISAGSIDGALDNTTIASLLGQLDWEAVYSSTSVADWMAIQQSPLYLQYQTHSEMGPFLERGEAMVMGAYINNLFANMASTDSPNEANPLTVHTLVDGEIVEQTITSREQLYQYLADNPGIAMDVHEEFYRNSVFDEAAFAAYIDGVQEAGMYNAWYGPDGALRMLLPEDQREWLNEHTDLHVLPLEPLVQLFSRDPAGIEFPTTVNVALPPEDEITALTFNSVDEMHAWARENATLMGEIYNTASAIEAEEISASHPTLISDLVAGWDITIEAPAAEVAPATSGTTREDPFAPVIDMLMGDYNMLSRGLGAFTGQKPWEAVIAAAYDPDRFYDICDDYGIEPPEWAVPLDGMMPPEAYISTLVDTYIIHDATYLLYSDSDLDAIFYSLPNDYAREMFIAELLSRVDEDGMIRLEAYGQTYELPLGPGIDGCILDRGGITEAMYNMIVSQLDNSGNSAYVHAISPDNIHPAQGPGWADPDIMTYGEGYYSELPDIVGYDSDEIEALIANAPSHVTSIAADTEIVTHSYPDGSTISAPMLPEDVTPDTIETGIWYAVPSSNTSSGVEYVMFQQTPEGGFDYYVQGHNDTQGWQTGHFHAAALYWGEVDQNAAIGQLIDSALGRGDGGAIAPFQPDWYTADRFSFYGGATLAPQASTEAPAPTPTTETEHVTTEFAASLDNDRLLPLLEEFSLGALTTDPADAGITVLANEALDRIDAGTLTPNLLASSLDSEAEMHAFLRCGNAGQVLALLENPAFIAGLPEGAEAWITAYLSDPAVIDSRPELAGEGITAMSDSLSAEQWLEAVALGDALFDDPANAALLASINTYLGERFGGHESLPITERGQLTYFIGADPELFYAMAGSANPEQMDTFLSRMGSGNSMYALRNLTEDQMADLLANPSFLQELTPLALASLALEPSQYPLPEGYYVDSDLYTERFGAYCRGPLSDTTTREFRVWNTETNSFEMVEREACNWASRMSANSYGSHMYAIMVNDPEQTLLQNLSADALLDLGWLYTHGDDFRDDAGVRNERGTNGLSFIYQEFTRRLTDPAITITAADLERADATFIQEYIEAEGTQALSNGVETSELYHCLSRLPRAASRYLANASTTELQALMELPEADILALLQTLPAETIGQLYSDPEFLAALPPDIARALLDGVEGIPAPGAEQIAGLETIAGPDESEAPAAAGDGEPAAQPTDALITQARAAIDAGNLDALWPILAELQAREGDPLRTGEFDVSPADIGRLFGGDEARYAAFAELIVGAEIPEGMPANLDDYALDLLSRRDFEDRSIDPDLTFNQLAPDPMRGDATERMVAGEISAWFNTMEAQGHLDSIDRMANAIASQPDMVTPSQHGAWAQAMLTHAASTHGMDGGSPLQEHFGPAATTAMALIESGTAHLIFTDPNQMNVAEFIDTLAQYSGREAIDILQTALDDPNLSAEMQVSLLMQYSNQLGRLNGPALTAEGALESHMARINEVLERLDGTEGVDIDQLREYLVAQQISTLLQMEGHSANGSLEVDDIEAIMMLLDTLPETQREHIEATLKERLGLEEISRESLAAYNLSELDELGLNEDLEEEIAEAISILSGQQVSNISRANSQSISTQSGIGFDADARDIARDMGGVGS